ncbi:MAG: DUF1840 domain-containing protein [Burkholderiales bacterium]
MAITFTCKASADVTMLDTHALSLFAILERDLAPRGVITAAQAPLALRRIQAAIDARGSEKAPEASEDPDAARDFVPLATRLWPFMEMLERAGNKGADILWGV